MIFGKDAIPVGSMGKSTYIPAVRLHRYRRTDIRRPWAPTIRL